MLLGAGGTPQGASLTTPRPQRRRSTLPDTGARDSVEPGVLQVSLPWERAPGIAPSNPGHRASSLLQVGKRQWRAAGCGTCQQLEPVSQHLHLGVRGAHWATRGKARGSSAERSGGRAGAPGAAAGSAERSPPPPAGFKKIHQWHSRAPQKTPAATWPGRAP